MNILRVLSLSCVINHSALTGVFHTGLLFKMYAGFLQVLYTGRRGRPKKLKPGEVDPHAEQRRKIKENLKKNCPSLARQLEEEEDEPDVQISPEIPEPAGSWLDQTNNQYQNTQRGHQIGANHQIQAQLVSQHPDNQHGKYI